MTTTEQITIKGVSIGDRFIGNNDVKSKRVSTVTDIQEIRSMATGEVVGYNCIASHDMMGQAITYQTPFSTVVKNKI